MSVHSIAPILVSRFLFDLQNAYRRTIEWESMTDTRLDRLLEKSVAFERMLGSLSSSIPHDSDSTTDAMANPLEHEAE